MTELGIVGTLLIEGIQVIGLIILPIYMHKINAKFSRQSDEMKADLEKRQAEMSQIYAFLSSLKLIRATTIQSKKIEAAEATFKDLMTLSQKKKFHTMEKISVNPEDIEDPTLQAVYSGLKHKIEKLEKEIKPLSDDAAILRKLYLDPKTQINFEAYSMLVDHDGVTLAMRRLEELSDMDLESTNQELSVQDKISLLVPESREAFEKHGSQYFYDQTVVGLLAIVNGVENNDSDAEAAQDLIETVQISRQDD